MKTPPFIFNRLTRALLALFVLSVQAHAEFHSSKKGVGASQEQHITALNVSWYYNWNIKRVDGVDPAIEYVPMKHNKNWRNEAELANIGEFQHFLGFNEPEAASQGNISVADAISQWPGITAKVEEHGQPGAKMGSPVTVNPNVPWIIDFMNQVDAQNLRVDFMTMHKYPTPTSSSNILSGAAWYHDTYGKDVWITEFNAADWSGTGEYTQADTYGWLAEVLFRLESTEYIKRYAIFPWDETWSASGPSPIFELDAEGNKSDVLTPLGRLYAEYRSVDINGPFVQTWYHIHNKGSKMHLTSNSGASSMSTIHTQGASVEFELIGAGGGNFFIARKDSGERLTSDGTTTTWSVGASDSSAKWSLETTNYNRAKIKHAASGKYLYGSDTGDVGVSASSSGSIDQWFFVRTGSEYIAPSNLAPVIDSEPTASANPVVLPATLDLSVVASDADGDELSYSWSKVSGPGTVIFANNNNPASATTTASFGATGNYELKVSVADSKGGVVEANLSIEAQGVANLPPKWNSPPTSFTATQGVAFQKYISWRVSDPDGDSIYWNKVSGPAWINVNLTSGELTGTPGQADVGTTPITISITDNNHTPVEHTFDLIVEGVNSAPEVNAGDPDTVDLVAGPGSSEATPGASVFLDAGLDDGTNNIWEDSLGYWSPAYGNGVTHLADAGSSLPGITGAYEFSGGTAGTEGFDGLGLHEQSIDRNPIGIEIWFKPDASATYPANGQVLYESGGTTGFGIFYNNGAVQVAHDGNKARISTDVSALTGEFIQVMTTYDVGSTTDNFKLYINGELKVTASRSDGDLCGGDGAGLGNRGDKNVGGAGGGDSGTASFDGQIAIFRLYSDQLLSESDVLANYSSIAEVSASAAAGLDATVTDADAGDTVSTTWSVVSGPAPVTFADASAVDTTVTFTVAGTYVLRLTAFDGTATVFSDVTITVNEPVTNTAPTATGGAATTDQDTPVLIPLTADDSEDDPLSYIIVSGPSHGGLSGSGDSRTYTPDPGYSGDDSFTFKVNDGNLDSGVVTVDITVNLVIPPISLVRTTVSGVSSSTWTAVGLGQSYTSPVIVATPIHPEGQTTPVVTRITNITESGFDVKLDRVDGLTDPVNLDVSVIVVEEGVYTQAEHGVTMEAVTFNSAITSSKAAWAGELRALQNAYTNPVVVGQVMSANDPNWSVFWSMGASRTDPADAANLSVGKHVGEDPNTTRANETIGYIVIEAGNGTIDGIAYEAATGSDTVKGFGDSVAPYSYALNGNLSSASAAAISQAAMDGKDGSWAVLSGSAAISSNAITLHLNEDMLADSEHKHTSEQVSYLVFE